MHNFFQWLQILWHYNLIELNPLHTKLYWTLHTFDLTLFFRHYFQSDHLHANVSMNGLSIFNGLSPGPLRLALRALVLIRKRYHGFVILLTIVPFSSDWFSCRQVWTHNMYYSKLWQLPMTRRIDPCCHMLKLGRVRMRNIFSMVSQVHVVGWGNLASSIEVLLGSNSGWFAIDPQGVNHSGPFHHAELMI